MSRIKMIRILFITILTISVLPSTGAGSIYINSALYQDWMGFKTTGSAFYNRLSTRLKMDIFDRPGDGWTLSLDIRNRATLGENSTNQLIIYNSNISFRSPDKRYYFTIGQTNLYDTAGTGELTGLAAGFRISRELSVGGYAGINPDIYRSRWDMKYRKYGIFASYRGNNARQITFSYNLLQFDNHTEREFIYGNVLFPVSSRFITYGSIEYELKDGIADKDRMTHLFVNSRFEPVKKVSLNFNYSSGKGMDYHRFILDHILDPSLKVSDVERYYYNESYGLRLTVSPIKNGRVYISKRFSEQRDRNIRNNTTRFGLSVHNILKTGFGFYGNYSLNRGDLSESDSYLFSLSRNFRRFSWSIALSSYFNAIRMSSADTPELIFNPDRRTLTTDLFFFLNRSLALSAEYSYSFSTGFTDHQFFIRAIYRLKQNKVKK